MRFNLKDFRQSHGLFQSDMAQLLEINQSNVSRAELRGYHDLTFPQKQKLYDKYGQEDVDSFMIRDAVVVTHNHNGEGTQNNGIFESDSQALDIIKQQSEALTELTGRYMEQTDKILSIIEKLSEKL